MSDRQDGFWWVRLRGGGGRWVCGELVTVDRPTATTPDACQRYIRIYGGSYIAEAVTQWGPYVPSPDEPGVEP